MQGLYEIFAEKEDILTRKESRKMQCQTIPVQMLEFPFGIIKIS
jgi:hypothetical protein